ncbi:MAG: hypothetical protein FWE28_08520 [Oscillospiraceae bacterium]|nr:hypothetical protein [Oscillospiraceae bacterium]
MNQYEVETKTVFFQGRSVTVTNRTPILSAQQREQRRREIESQLYPVVKKYVKTA